MGVCQYGCANMGVCSPLDQTGCSSLSVQWQVSPVSPVASSSGKQELGRSQWVESLLSALSLSFHIFTIVESHQSHFTSTKNLPQIWLSSGEDSSVENFCHPDPFQVWQKCKKKACKMLRKKSLVSLKPPFRIWTKGSSPPRKTVKKADIVRFGRLPPKRVKSGHLLSDYRQKCVNATRNILMSKARKIWA